ncbi:thiopurine S-methyltransferase [Psychromonas sp. CNPT3]|uniref:thiopurine S-methyltransferase n=1 Tax=Psychromonas sp. CNPT3 TaxID=314282 RepID=UPI00006E70D5|nr:thiopurine S-methyltransferase [Psychromonas sp. CNPT3]AGH81462.1 thiopurine S-methyltransferase [Psychromonas sp. CNPT3]
MHQAFWHEKWKKGQIGFHQSTVNPQLIKHIEALSLEENDRVFVPLCGKTLDIAWLLEQGYRVVGAELVEQAVVQLFASLRVTPVVINLGEIKHYQGHNIDIFVGDIFTLSAKQLGSVDAIYDRAAFVALPDPMRRKYTQHVAQISQGAKQLLITFEYDQTLLCGPPFACPKAQIKQYYEANYVLSLLTSSDIEGGIKGIDAIECVWLLQTP